MLDNEPTAAILIARRVLIGFVAVLVVSVVSLGSVVILAHRSSASMSRFQARTDTLRTSVMTLESDFYNYDDRMNMYVAVLLGHDNQNNLAEITYQQAAAAGQSMGKDLSTAQGLAPDAAIRASLARVAKDFVGYNSFADQVRADALTGNYAKALWVQTVGNLIPSNDIMPALAVTQGQVNALATSTLHSVRGEQGTITWVSVAAIFVIVGLILALGALLLLYVFRPLKSLQDGIRSTASPDRQEGDRLDVVRLDEIGQVATAFNAMLASLERRDAEIAASRLEREEQLKEKFETQHAAQKALRQRAQEMIDETAATVSHELGEVVRQMAAVREAAGTIDRKVTSVDALTSNAVEQAERTNQVLGTFSESLARVSSMTALIAQVSDKTKLLALNATIEAARAGAAGRGFSVVADEVKELANTTAQSNEQISATVATLAASAKGIGDAISSVTESIEGVDESTEALSGIATNQFELVGRLDQALSETIERLTNMTSLTQKLEQRGHVRTPVSLKARLRVGASVLAVRMTDISEGGCSVTLGAGDAVDQETATVEFDLDGQSFSEHATVARSAGSEVGLRFTVPDARTLAAVQAYVARQAEAVLV